MQSKNLKILRKKEAEALQSRIEKFSGRKIQISDLTVMTDKDGRVFVGSREISEFDFSGLEVTSVGMYLGRFRADSFEFSKDSETMIKFGKFSLH